MNTYQTNRPKCPHCGHMLTIDEMNDSVVSDTDLWGLALAEEHADITCPECSEQYAVQGGYSPHYTSAANLDELSA